MRPSHNSLFALFIPTRLRLVFTIGVMALWGVSSALAATLTWDGTGSNNSNWLTKQNWGNVDIAANDNLVFGGIVRLTNNNNTLANQVYTSITFNNTAGAFVLNGNSVTVGTGGITNNSANNQTFDTLPLILTSSSGNFNAASGNLTVNSAISGPNGVLTKTGANVLTLANTNSYTGATTINQGTLLVSGSIGSSAVTVNNSGTVLASGTTGTIGASATVNSGAILAPGGTGSIGTATVGSGGLAMNAGSVFSWDVTSDSSFDKVTVAALTSTNAIFNIVTNMSAPFWNGDQTFIGIFSGATNLAGNFSSIQLNGSTLTGGLVTGRGTFAFDGGNLTYSAIPEPTSALAGILLVGGLLRRRR